MDFGSKLIFDHISSTLQEPCLIHSSCNVCEIGTADCAARLREQYAKNATALRDINKYGARLEYSCGPAKEFAMDDSGGTKPRIEMECNWDSTWTPTENIRECTWEVFNRTISHLNICVSVLQFATTIIIWKNDSPLHLCPNLHFNLQIKMPKLQINIRNGTVPGLPAPSPLSLPGTATW